MQSSVISSRSLGAPAVHQARFSSRATIPRPSVVTTTPVPSFVVRSMGKDVVEGFFDLAKLVASEGKASKSPYEELSYKIGQDVYADIQGWHLFLKDMNAGVAGSEKMKMNQLLGNLLGPMADSGKVDEQEVENTLRKIPVVFGKGKLKMPLYDVIPSANYRDLLDILKDARR